MISKSNCLSSSITRSSVAPLVSANSADVPGVTFSRTCLMKSSSMPTSAREPMIPPIAAPMAIPSSGIKKISPNRNPQNAPPSAPAPPMLASWRVWGFLRSAGQLTTAASSRVISWRSCMPCKASSTRSAPLGSLNFSTDSVAKTHSSFLSLFGCLVRCTTFLGLVICVLRQPVDDEGVERDDHDRQHRRHRDMKEPPYDPQASEYEARGQTERPTPEEAAPRVHRDRADNQVDDAPDEQDRDEQLDIETTLHPGAVGELRDREQDVEAAQYEHHNRSVREQAGTPHRWGSLSPLFHHFFLSLAPFLASRICPLASCHGVRLAAEERCANPLEGGLPLLTENPRRGILGNLACPV